METAGKAADEFGQRTFAKAAGISLQHLSAILQGAATPMEATVVRLTQGATTLGRLATCQKQNAKAIVEQIRNVIAKSSLRHTARLAGLDPGNLARMLSGERSIPSTALTKLQKLVKRQESVIKTKPG